MKIYGIPNCDVTKKTFEWLKANKIEFEFHDYKKEGISASKLKSWVNQAGMAAILNKRSTTWRGLSVEEQQSINNQTDAINLMANNNSLIKRPVIEADGKVVMIGFDENQYNLKLRDL